MAATNGSAKPSEQQKKALQQKSGLPPPKPEQQDGKQAAGLLKQTLAAVIVALLGVLAWFTYDQWLPTAVLRLESALPPSLSGYIPQDLLIESRTSEVASLMSNIYDTLAEMRYLDASGIARGPHKPENFTSSTTRIHPAIRKLYTKLPYVDGAEAGNYDFLLGSEFVDFRTEHEVDQARDPFHRSPKKSVDDTNGRYVKPWQTPLVKVEGGQGILLIYDVKTHRIWMIDQSSTVSADPALIGTPNLAEIGNNRNTFEHIPSRPAAAVLKDYVHWLKALKYIPGNGRNSKFEGLFDYTALKSLYETHGWPDSFNGDAFEIARTRWYGMERAKYNADDPVREKEKFTTWLQAARRDLEARSQQVAAATTPDDEWIAKWEFFKLGGIYSKIGSDLAEAEKEAERKCPGGVPCYKEEDLPLWEAEQLRAEVETRTGQMKAYENILIQMRNESLPAENRPNPAQLATHISMMKIARHDLAVYEQAYLKSKHHAETLFPNTTFQQATGLANLQFRTIDREIAQAVKAVDWAAEQMEAHSSWHENETPQGDEREALGGLGVFEESVRRDMGALIRQHAGLKAHRDRGRKWREEHGGGIEGEGVEGEVPSGEVEGSEEVGGAGLV
ncbi:hypothetical protein LTR62_006027 [Meristemomyces frigidus]|uniref:Uncharacterized protein n=1 Tax=Meristemomyces frigidus TaxID=1508187 RepID=A0AAN7THK7_9PEZI|nr:hypothetical protein LTR62_006027 [Meristemomyces frigidus]